MENTDPDALIARLTARRHHLVTRRRLLPAGLTSRQIDRRTSSGLLVPLHPGMYLLGGGSPTFEQRTLAAAWAAGGLASHHCAARLYRLRRVEAAAVEITVPLTKAPKLAGVLCHRRAVLPASDRTTVAGIPATTPARVLLDICDGEARRLRGRTRRRAGQAPGLAPYHRPHAGPDRRPRGGPASASSGNSSTPAAPACAPRRARSKTTSSPKWEGGAGWGRDGAARVRRGVTWYRPGRKAGYERVHGLGAQGATGGAGAR